MSNRNLLIFVSAAALILLSGCSFLSGLLAPSSLPLEQAAVAAAVYTAETQGNADPTTQHARAVKINTIAKQVLAIDQNTSMALVDVEAIVDAKIAALNLPAPDLIVANMLTAALGQALSTQLALTTKGAISPQTQIAIADVCNWIITDTGG